MRYADAPIYRPKEDVLGRSDFALALAKAIDNIATAREGFVISIVGEWGAGKSSVVEMIIRHLTHLEMERASREVLWGDTQATPHDLAEIESLAEVFDTIKLRVDEYNTLDLNFSATQRLYSKNIFQSWLRSDAQTDQADKYWRLLCKINEHRRTTIVRFSPWLIAGRSELANALLSELARALGQQFGDELKDAFASLLGRLSELAPIAGVGLDAVTTPGIGKLLSLGTKWSAEFAATLTSGPTLDGLRENLRRALAKIENQRILIIVDDLDRLTPNEALEMISLVKSLGSLPNVVYLLSYDENNLAKLINQATHLNGNEFIKKIVQYSVNLPPISQDALSQLLDTYLSESLGDLSESEQSRIGYIWLLVLKHYIRTPRDIRLFANSVIFALSSLRDVVDKVDLLTLEALRIFEPRIYQFIRENIDELAE